MTIKSSPFSQKPEGGWGGRGPTPPGSSAREVSQEGLFLVPPGNSVSQLQYTSRSRGHPSDSKYEKEGHHGESTGTMEKGQPQSRGKGSMYTEISLIINLGML